MLTFYTLLLTCKQNICTLSVYITPILHIWGSSMQRSPSPIINTVFLQVTQTFFWTQIRSIIMGLNPNKLQRLINEIKKYDGGISNFIQSRRHSSLEVINDIMETLKRLIHLNGQKCIVCVLNYLFHQSDLGDLANQIKRI